MDFEYSEEQRMLADSLRRLMADNWTMARRRARQGGLDSSAWNALAELGVLGLVIDAEHGGFGEPPASLLPVHLELGAGLADEPVIPSSVMAATALRAGGNMEAARLSGIDVWGVKSATLAITGGLTAVSGILIASLIGSGTGTTATGMELDVIAATIIGGTSLFGGKGRIGGTLIGVLFLGCISNGMTLLDVNEYWQYVARGAIILLAVLINQTLERSR